MGPSAFPTSANNRQIWGTRRAGSVCCWHGVSLLSETEKPARGGLFLFLSYKFRISHGENKTAKIL